MVIVKHGNLKEEDFTCERCGCEFLADMTEYRESYSNHEKYYIIQCPDCNTGVYKLVEVMHDKLYNTNFMEVLNYVSKTNC